MTCVANIFYHLRVEKGSFNVLWNLVLPVLGIAINCYIFYKNFLKTFLFDADELQVPDVDHDGVLRARAGRGGVHVGRHSQDGNREDAPPLLRARRRNARLSDRFDGRNVIVTGGGRGIGQATARAFAREGANVLVLGRNEADLESTVSAIEADGGRAWHLTCDVRDEAQVDATVARAVERVERIHVLVNNAGIDDDTPFLEIDRARWRDIIDTNLTGPFLMSHAVARHMAANGGGAILHNASIDASGGDGPFAAYNASKAGLLGLNRTMALELAEHGIRSNCVSPGFTHTDMTEKAVGPKLMDYLNGSFARVPMKRLVRPDEIAAGVPVPRLRRRLGDHGHRPARRLRPHGELVHPRDAAGGLTTPTLTEDEVAGWRALRLDNGALAVTVLPDKGAELHAFEDLASGVQMLFAAPWGLQPPGSPPREGSGGEAFLERYAGGWQELFPNTNGPCVVDGQELPFHGEVALLPWTWEVVRDDADELAVRFEVTCQRAPLRLARTMRLAATGRRLVLDETVTNLFHAPVQFVWGHHCVLGAPLVADGARLVTSAGTIVTIPEMWEDTARLEPGQRSPWPMARTRDGGEVDLRESSGRRPRATTTCT